jgi:hypothetical protein
MVFGAMLFYVGIRQSPSKKRSTGYRNGRSRHGRLIGEAGNAIMGGYWCQAFSPPDREAFRKVDG